MSSLSMCALAMCVIAACSKPSSESSSKGGESTGGQAGSVCDRKLLTVDDVRGILSEPITGTQPLNGDPQTCSFITKPGGPKIRVTYRAGLGKTTIEGLLTGKLNVDATPINGIGDSAAWVKILTEIDAEKDDRLCVIRLAGSAAPNNSGDDLPAKLGALCNKIFVAAK